MNKFMLIYNQMVDKIEKGEYPPSTLLPSENELKDSFQTSRETIRKALNLLSQNGYIQKIRGKGSVVIDITKMNLPVSGLVSFKELAEKMGREPITTVHELSLIHPDRELTSHLNPHPKDLIWKVVRTREIGGEKVILDKDYLLKSAVPTLTKEVCEDSIYSYIENQLGLQISFAKKEILIEEPTEEDHSFLDIDGFHNVVVIRSQVFLEDASLFQYTESRHRPDKFRFVDFARRRPTV
ncbi:trehalose operon repressor [Bacillus sp. C11]|nr:trehalose operon repressor [Neobacillus terrae]